MRRAKKKPTAHGSKVEVTWLDSCHTSGWKRGDWMPGEMVVVSLGFLVREDGESMSIAQSMSPVGAYADVLDIPMTCVKRVVKVRP